MHEETNTHTHIQACSFMVNYLLAMNMRSIQILRVPHDMRMFAIQGEAGPFNINRVYDAK